jgi:fatty acid desaturase
VFLAVAFAQVGFLGHDAGHRQVFRSRRANDVLGVLCGNLATGLSYGWWTGKHNRHHAHPNTEGADPDIMISVLAFSGSRARASGGIQRLAFRYQARQGRGLHPRAAGRVRVLPRVLVRAQP